MFRSGFPDGSGPDRPDKQSGIWTSIEDDPGFWFANMRIALLVGGLNPSEKYESQLG